VMAKISTSSARKVLVVFEPSIPLQSNACEREIGTYVAAETQSTREYEVEEGGMSQPRAESDQEEWRRF